MRQCSKLQHYIIILFHIIIPGQRESKLGPNGEYIIYIYITLDKLIDPLPLQNPHVLKNMLSNAGCSYAM